MLALQRPRMESNHPPDPSLPFGYSFNELQDVFPDPPPSPPPGEPILTAQDSMSLHNFLENLSSIHFNMPCYGEGLNFTDTWLDLPPEFVGSTTSFGQQSGADSPVQHPVQMNNGNHVLDDTVEGSARMMAPPPPPHGGTSHPHHPNPLMNQQVSSDVLAAAAMLPRNGLIPANGFHSGHMMPQFTSLRDLGPNYKHEPGAALGHSLLRSGFDGSNNGEHQFPGMPYGGHHPPPPPPPPRVPVGGSQASEIQWGSDASFSQTQGFVPQSHRDTHESLMQRQMDLMQCLEVSRSAATTRPSSPIADHPSPVGADTNGEGPPRKRRKSGTAKEEEEDEEAAAADPEVEPLVPATGPKSGRRRKAKAGGQGPSTGEGAEAGGRNGTPTKRRKSANGAKSARENLTDEQKRSNHIRSEQKRRTVIKEGFDDLCSLVPQLRGSSLSKSNMLTAAADWLEELVRYNKELTDQLARLSA